MIKTIKITAPLYTKPDHNFFLVYNTKTEFGLDYRFEQNGNILIIEDILDIHDEFRIFNYHKQTLAVLYNYSITDIIYA